MPEVRVKYDISSEDFLADLTDAAYRVALKRGFKGSFLDFELELQDALHEVIQRKMAEEQHEEVESLPLRHAYSESHTKSAQKTDQLS